MNPGDTDLIIRHLTAENAHDLEGTLARLVHAVVDFVGSQI